jgi:hypothetical protein
LGSGDTPLDRPQAFRFASRELLNAKETELLLQSEMGAAGAPNREN